MLLEREEWGGKHKVNNRGKAASETDGMKRESTEKS